MINEETRLDFIEKHAPRALYHYVHAKEKHPYFCDRLIRATTDERDFVKTQLEFTRIGIKFDAQYGRSNASDLIECEMLEAHEALHLGDKAHAVEELYDTIAVCLRAIDVLEGRQKLGKPETKGEAK